MQNALIEIFLESESIFMNETRCRITRSSLHLERFISVRKVIRQAFTIVINEMRTSSLKGAHIMPREFQLSFQDQPFAFTFKVRRGNPELSFRYNDNWQSK